MIYDVCTHHRSLTLPGKQSMVVALACVSTFFMPLQQNSSLYFMRRIRQQVLQVSAGLVIRLCVLYVVETKALVFVQGHV